jgi:hypothetical protein
MISDETVLDFVAAVFKSVWALELLLALKRDPTRAWRAADIIRELRSSQTVATEALHNLVAAGLVTADDNGNYRYRAGSPVIDEIVAALEKLYAVKPTAVIERIVSSPNTKLQILSDAFRIKE